MPGYIKEYLLNQQEAQFEVPRGDFDYRRDQTEALKQLHLLHYEKNPPIDDSPKAIGEAHHKAALAVIDFRSQHPGWDNVSLLATYEILHPDQFGERREQQERSISPKNLSDKQIVDQVKVLHQHFRNLSEEYKTATAEQSVEIVKEMRPIVERENALRKEYNSRGVAMEIGYK